MKTIIAISALLLLSGCATLINGTHQQITVITEPGNDVYVDGKFASRAVAGVSVEPGRPGFATEGSAVVGGLAKVNVSRKSSHTITIKREGCEDVSVETTRTTNPNVWWNIFTYGIGALVDWGTGAIHKIDPDQYWINPRCPTESIPENKKFL